MSDIDDLKIIVAHQQQQINALMTKLSSIDSNVIKHLHWLNQTPPGDVPEWDARLGWNTRYPHHAGWQLSSVQPQVLRVEAEEFGKGFMHPEYLARYGPTPFVAAGYFTVETGDYVRQHIRQGVVGVATNGLANEGVVGKAQMSPDGSVRPLVYEEVNGAGEALKRGWVSPDGLHTQRGTGAVDTFTIWRDDVTGKEGLRLESDHHMYFVKCDPRTQEIVFRARVLMDKDPY